MTAGAAVIQSLRRVASIGIVHAPTFLDEEHKDWVRWLVSEGYLQDMLVAKMEGAELEKAATLLIGRLTNRVLMNASYSVDAASVVFGHTVLEDAVNSYLEITTEVLPEYWKRRVERKSVELGKLKESSVDELTGKAVLKELQNVRNESLVRRADLLHEICKTTVPFGEYKYSQEMLGKIDKLRQEIVHGNDFGVEQIADIDAKIKYFHDTGLYFFIMMNKAFGLRLDPALFRIR
jgi:hypothetical protein